ncbi:efflux RND transporter periplasmic adaptor subunit [bacterium]|nr:efflux RND transporter periplasmic adaptor subunit [bacterium]
MNRFHALFLAAYKYIIIMAVLVLVFFVIRRLNSSEEEQKIEFTTEQSEESRPISVGGERAFVGDLVIRVSATGIAGAAGVVDITPEVSGRILEVTAREGDYVKKGDPIFTIDDTRYWLSYEDARDNVRSAQAVFVDQLFTKYGSGENGASREQGTKLWYETQNEADFKEAERRLREGKISEEEFAEARLFYETAKEFAGQNREDRVMVRSGLAKALIAEKRARIDLDATVVRAPFSGILGDQEICAGQYIAAGTPCFKLVDLSVMHVEAGCLESEIKDIQAGRTAEVSFSGFPGESFTGTVMSINPLVDPESKTCRVTVAVANPGNRIKAGMFAFVKLEATILKDRLLVPREAILVRNERDLLFIARNGKAVWDYVDLGRSNETYYEILGDQYQLAAGDTVLTENHYTMYHDALITVVDQ